MALVVSDMAETQAFTVHKTCYSNKPRSERLPLTAELDTFLMWLLWNSGLSDETKFKKAAENARGLLAV
jgi:hypothetical protein